MSFMKEGQANAKKPAPLRKTTSSSFSSRGELELQSTRVSGFDLEGSLVSDDERDSLGMPPIRIGASRKDHSARARKTTRDPPQQLGQPITADDVMAKLNPLELEMLDRFMKEAKKTRGKIMEDNGFSRITSVFVDGVLQKFGIFLPTTKENMSEIAGSTDKVEDFGAQFLALCRKFAKEKEENFADVDVGDAPIFRGFSQLPAAGSFITLDDDEEDYSGGIADEDFENGDTSEYFRKDVANMQKVMLNQWEAGASQARPKKATASSRGGSRGGRARGSKKPYARRTSGAEPGSRRQSGSTGVAKGRGVARGAGASSRGGSSASSRGSGPKPMW